MKRTLRAQLKAAVDGLDRRLAPTLVRYGRERGTLSTLLFHSVFKDEAEAASGEVDPQQGTTVADICQLIEYFRSSGYQFVRPEQLTEIGRQSAPCLMLTFDDGYANNLNLLPILERYQVPATVFISTGHVRDQRAFWWDVVYREGRKRGRSSAEILAEQQALKAFRHDEIERQLTARYGEGALKPVGDTDRPLTIDELRVLAAHPFIDLGNHTVDHALLDHLDVATATQQIVEAQQWLEAETGKTAAMISYPNGNVNGAVLEATQAAGLQLGITTVPRKARLPLRAAERLSIPRYVVTSGPHFERDLVVLRSAVQLGSALRRRGR